MTVYCQGSFDIIHSGHMNLLKKCRKLAGDGGKVIIALLTDRAYEKYRGYKPAKPFSERLAVLEAIKYVDKVIASNNEDTRAEIIHQGVDLIVVGTDWAGKDIYTQYRMNKEELNPLLIFHPYTTEITSTQIKERIKNQ